MPPSKKDYKLGQQLPKAAKCSHLRPSSEPGVLKRRWLDGMWLGSCAELVRCGPQVRSEGPARDLSAAVIVCGTALFCIAAGPHLSPGLSGLCLTYALAMAQPM